MWWARSFNRWLAAAFFGVSLIPASLTGSVVALPFFLLFALYLLCLALLVEWVILSRRQQEGPELPVGPASWRGHARVKYALLVYVALFTLAREGAFAPDFVLSVQWYTANTNTEQSNNTSTNSSSTNGASVAFAGRYTDCHITCSGDSALCDGFMRGLRCDNQREGEERPQETLYISGQASFGAAPFCYTPLYKSGRVAFHTNLSLSAGSNGASKGGTLLLDGSVEQSLMGLSSCYLFLDEMSQAAATQTAQALNQFIQAN